jgi:hypothetical protein
MLTLLYNDSCRASPLTRVFTSSRTPEHNKHSTMKTSTVRPLASKGRSSQLLTGFSMNKSHSCQFSFLQLLPELNPFWTQYRQDNGRLGAFHPGGPQAKLYFFQGLESPESIPWFGTWSSWHCTDVTRRL